LAIEGANFCGGFANQPLMSRALGQSSFEMSLNIFNLPDLAFIINPPLRLFLGSRIASVYACVITKTTSVELSQKVCRVAVCGLLYFLCLIWHL
jgi:hypothetical protein